MKPPINYSIVITTYNNPAHLKLLIQDIHTCTKRYLPSEIIISDDCSSGNDVFFVAKRFSTRSIPIRALKLKNHAGPLYAEAAGLNAVKTEFAIVLHADTRLVGDCQIEMYNDPLSVLASFVSQTSDASAVSLYSLAIENSIHVQRGPRSLGIDGMPYSYYMDYRFASLFEIEAWHRDFSCDGNIYALRMDAYNKVNGFDVDFAPYLFYHDDFFARARQKGYHVYFTRDTVAYHPRYADKPEGTLAIADGRLYTLKSELFAERWGGSSMWSADILTGERVIKEYIGRQ